MRSERGQPLRSAAPLMRISQIRSPVCEKSARVAGSSPPAATDQGRRHKPIRVAAMRFMCVLPPALFCKLPPSQACRRGTGHPPARPCRLLQFEIEQLDCVGAGNLQLVRLGHLQAVKPARSIIGVLERIVDREQNAVDAHHGERALKGRCAEVAAGGDIEIFQEIFAQIALAGVSARAETHACVDAPQAVGDALAHVSDDYLQVGIVVEQARAAQPQRVQGGVRAESPGRTRQPGMPFIGCLAIAARMKVKGYIKLGYLPPETTVCRDVVIDAGIGFVFLGKPVDQRSLESEVFDAASEFGRCGLRILHRQRGESCKAIRALGHQFGQFVVGAPGKVNRFLGVQYRLHRRRVQRHDGEFDAVLVHFSQAYVAQVEDLALEGIPMR